MTSKFYVLSPHPEVIKAWQESGYIPNDLESKTQEQIFFQSVGKAKSEVFTFGMPPEEYRKSFVVSTDEDPTRKIIRRVTKMLRTDTNNVVYNESFEGERWDNGDLLTHTRVVGRFGMPQFRRQVNRESGTSQISGIRDIKPTFEIPLTDEEFTDPSTKEETTLAKLYEMAAPGFVFYINTHARKYALRGITLDEFINKPLADLIHYGEKESWPVPVPDKSVFEDVMSDNTAKEAAKLIVKSKRKVEANE